MDNIHKITEDLLVLNLDENRQEEVICQICSNFLIKPWEHSVCGKLICKSCLDERLKTHNTCPYCRQDITDSVHYSKRCELYVKNLRISCCNSQCKEIITIGEIDEHLNNKCNYENIKCFNCKELVLRLNLSEHNDNCSERYVICSLCSFEYKFNEYDKHKIQCPEELVKCTLNMCDKIVKNKDMIDHINNCDYVELTCNICHMYRDIRKFYDINHINKCPMKIISCELCSKLVTLIDLQKHTNEECVERLIQCSVCNENVIRKNLFSHLSNECENRFTICSLCKYKVDKNQLSSHLIYECQSRSILCSQCNVTVKYNQIREHEFVCQESNIACIKCNKTYKRRESYFHHLFCVSEIISCPHKDWSGCNFRCNRKDMIKHSDDLHLHIMYAKKYVDNLNAENYKLQNDNKYSKVPYLLFEKTDYQNFIKTYQLYIKDKEEKLYHPTDLNMSNSLPIANLRSN